MVGHFWGPSSFGSELLVAFLLLIRGVLFRPCFVGTFPSLRDTVVNSILFYARFSFIIILFVCCHFHKYFRKHTYVHVNTYVGHFSIFLQNNSSCVFGLTPKFFYRTVPYRTVPYRKFQKLHQQQFF